MPEQTYDTVIVGAGIGGGALSTALAGAGLSVLVLEKTLEHRDRVRGEWMAPWGVAEAQALGLYDALVAAGAHHVTRHVGYEEGVSREDAEAGAIPLTAMLPDVPGALTMRHPDACDLFDRLAVEAGATLLRGIDDIAITCGPAPTVRYAHEGQEHAVSCRLIVGADGRGSLVRQQAGIALHTDPQHHLFAGLLVEGAHSWPEDTQSIGTVGDVMYLVFPQGGGRARLYIAYGSEKHRRFNGADGPQAFLDAFRLDCVPQADQIAGATPAGPCNSYPNQDAWTDAPYAEGVVLIGDAAGYNDPIIGQGLSITLRDVRMVRDALLAERSWTPAIFEAYAEERRERMRRLRFSAMLMSTQNAEFGEEARARKLRSRARQGTDPMLGLAFAALFVGPEKLPLQAFDDSVRERLFAPA